jgi:uncharacterized membrane protein YgdD (TMEM256/DUF423 family)
MTAGRWLVILAGLVGFSGVLLAALGAHAVPGMEQPANYRSWQSASLLHLVHAVVVLVLGIHIARCPSRLLVVAAGLMLLGIVLFSGSIYARVAFDLEKTFNLAPMGGFALMLGWILLPCGVLRR